MPEHRLLLISRDDILDHLSVRKGNRLFRTLAQLSRGGFQLLATAPQPEHWSKEHGGPDDTLLGPESIRRRLSDVGGFLQGVYYVPRSLLTQKRNREEALRDMTERYSIEASHCHLYSSSRKFVDVANELGMNATHLDKERLLLPELKILLNTFDF